MELVMLLPGSWERVGLLLATGVVLGLAMPLGKLAGDAGVGALSFALIPAGGAAVLLSLQAWRRHGRPAAPGRLLAFGAVAGLMGNAIPSSLTAWLSYSAGAGFTGLAYTLPPVFTLSLLLALGWERWQVLRVVAVVLGLVGAVWLVGARAQVGGVAASSAVLLLVVPLAIGVGNVFRARYLPPGVPATWLGAAMSIGAFAWLLPAWWLAPPGLSELNAAGARYVLVQMFAGTVGVLLFFELQLRSEPVAMSFVGYVIALTAVLSSATLLGERLPLQLLPAALLIASGFWLIQRTAARRGSA